MELRDQSQPFFFVIITGNFGGERIQFFIIFEQVAFMDVGMHTRSKKLSFNIFIFEGVSFHLCFMETCNHVTRSYFDWVYPLLRRFLVHRQWPLNICMELIFRLDIKRSRAWSWFRFTVSVAVLLSWLLAFRPDAFLVAAGTFGYGQTGSTIWIAEDVGLAILH